MKLHWCERCAKGEIAGAGLMFTSTNLRFSPELLRMPNALLLPHSAVHRGNTPLHVNPGGGKSAGGAGRPTVPEFVTHFEPERRTFRAQLLFAPCGQAPYEEFRRMGYSARNLSKGRIFSAAASSVAMS